MASDMLLILVVVYVAAITMATTAASTGTASTGTPSQATAIQHSFQKVRTVRGKDAILYKDGHVFYKNPNKKMQGYTCYICRGSFTSWKKEPPYCRMNICINNTTLEVIECGYHQKHDATYDATFYGANKLRQEMKDEIRESGKAPRKVYEDKIAKNLKEGTKCFRKGYKGVRQTLLRTAAEERPKLPNKTSEIFDLLDANSSYLSNKYGIKEFYNEQQKQRYLYPHPDDPNIVIFHTKAQSKMFKNADTLMCDGTMKITPWIAKNVRPWKQVFNILIIIQGKWGAHSGFLGFSAFLPGHYEGAYRLVIGWLLDVLNERQCRMKKHVTFICDYEVGMRNGLRIQFTIYDHTYEFTCEMFHHIKSQWKRIKKFHLAGLYNFNNDNDPSFVNFFKYWVRCIFCLPLMPKISFYICYDLCKTNVLESVNYFEWRKLKLTKSNSIKMISKYLTYYEDVRGHSDSSKYNMDECNCFGKMVRCSNCNETYHNTMLHHCGEHKPLWTCVRGMQDLEFIDVSKWIQLTLHDIEPTRIKYYVEREKKLAVVWNLIKEKMKQFENKLDEIDKKFWFKCLFDIHDIMYLTKGNELSVDAVAAKVVEDEEIASVPDDVASDE